jgi:hypothetical protein
MHLGNVACRLQITPFAQNSVKDSKEPGRPLIKVDESRSIEPLRSMGADG